jgi:hypothetical protein
MWLCLNDSFFSLVSKNCSEGQLLVRARREGDIERVFGRRHVVTRDTCADYLYRAVISREEIKTVMAKEVDRIHYPNFKDSVEAKDLHDAYMGVWSNMAAVQDPAPYSGLTSYRRHSSLGMLEPIQQAPEAREVPFGDATRLVPMKAKKGKKGGKKHRTKP